MSPRAIILIVAALLTVGGTVYFARSWLDSERQALEAMKQKKPTKAKPKYYVLVAKVNLPAGTFLQKNHMAWQAWPEGGLHRSYIRRRGFNQKSLSGVVVRKHIAAGQPISGARIVRPGQRGFMAAVLNPGMRAVSLRASAVTSVAGFAFPGDRVDILLTHRVGGGRGGRLVTETMLTNVRILAIDQKVTDGNQKAAVGKTVTIEVTPRQAEVMAVAKSLGQLSLALRSLRQTAGGKDQILANGVVLDLDSLDRRPPGRGNTHTWDSGTSRLLRRQSNNIKILIVRGNKRSSIAFPKGP